MGCSPSKGNNFGTQGPFRRGRTLLPGHHEVPGESQSDDGGSGCSSGAGDTDSEAWERGAAERRPAGQIHSSQKEASSTLQKKRASLSEVVPECVVLDKLGGQDTENNTVSQGKEKKGDKQDTSDKKSDRKHKKNGKGVKLTKKRDKEKKAPAVEQKVDFPEPLVKAHQAAYAFLNPSITKYDILLGLLEQATQTQVSVQPMVAFMAMRYEEINRGLREMAEEGEKLLKENGDHLAWPSLMKNLSSSNFSKSVSTNEEPPPDLLQQLLQYTTQRMRNVGQSVGGIGDSALEEAVEYFTSVSELFEEKLKAKRATESRLMQLLTRIEAASVRKPGPDDSALFSEDSGIGAESESLAGSERRLRRGSSESIGTIRTSTCSPTVANATPNRQGAPGQRFTHKKGPSISLNSTNSSCAMRVKDQRDTESLLGSASLDDGEEEEDNGPEEGAEGGEGDGRKQSHSSPTDPDQPPRRLPSKRIENPQNVEMTLKMKDAISGRIRFVPSQHASSKTKPTESPKTSRRQWTEEEKKSPKRPQTAAPIRKSLKKAPVAKERRSQSEESLRSKAEDPTLLELERTQRVLSQRLESMSKGKTVGNNKTNPTKQSQGTAAQCTHRLRPSMEKTGNSLPVKDKAGLVKNKTGEQVVSKNMEDDKTKTDRKTTQGPLRATPPPSPPLLRPSSGLHRGRNSVKKLIDTFSQGMEEPKPESSYVLGPLKGVRKCGVPILPGLGNVEAALSSGLTSCRGESSEKHLDLDLDSLPPPPLEVLMDNSFEGAQSLSVGDMDDGVSGRGRTPARRATVSQRLRASMQSVTVLPSRGSMPRGSRSMSPARTIRRPDMSAMISQPEGVQISVDPETEEAASLYKQARKVIHLRHSYDSNEEKPVEPSLPMRPPLNQGYPGNKQVGGKPDGINQSEIVPPATVVGSRPPATPPVSRARMLPTTPSTTGSLHRRLPSPPMFKRQPTPPSSNSPPVIRKLPTPPPSVQRRLPSPPVVRREMTPNSCSASAFSFKAPSPPASPRIQRWTRENSSEDLSSASRLISNARSVFCPASPSLFEAQSCPVPKPPQAWTATGVNVLPRPWGDRGRLPVSVRGPQPFVRRSLSDRRPSLSMPPQAPTISMAHTCGSEPALSLKGLEDEPTREDELWSSQLDLRGTARSASHPELCIVGQALHRE